MSKTVEEYKKSLKMGEAEEILDLIFYRPIALGFVKLVYRLPMTPNQVTYLSLLAGLACAYYFSQGTPEQFAVAGIWYAIANMLDCADGQLARLQNSGTPLGRLVDGVVDWIISVAIFIGLGIGLAAQTGEPIVWYLVVAGGLTSAIHSILFDYYQQDYIAKVRGQKSYLTREIEKIETELQKGNHTKNGTLRRIPLHIYLNYLRIQQRSQLKKVDGREVLPDLYRDSFKRLTRWWTFLGATTNRSLLIIAALFHQPEIFLWIIVVPGNVYLAIILLWQRSIQRRLDDSLKRRTIQQPVEAPAQSTTN
jgi:phosphatidylglycerophosphate synthase